MVKLWRYYFSGSATARIWQDWWAEGREPQGGGKGCRLPEEGEDSGVSGGSRPKPHARLPYLGKGEQTSLACQHMVAPTTERCRCDTAGDGLRRVCSNWKGHSNTRTVWWLTCWQVWLTPVRTVWAFRCFGHAWGLRPKFLNQGCAEIHPFLPPLCLPCWGPGAEHSRAGEPRRPCGLAASLTPPGTRGSGPQDAAAPCCMDIPGCTPSLFWEQLECLQAPGGNPHIDWLEW